MKIIIILLIMILPKMGLAYEDALTERALFINNLHVRHHSRLNYPEDSIGYQEAQNRVKSILRYSKELNNMYPDADPKDVALNLFFIIEWETAFINYGVEHEDLDNGNSFGMISMKKSTAEEIIDNLSLEDRYMYDTDLQAKLATYYYYRALSHFGGEHRMAILSYNRGFNIRDDLQRYENYYFQVIGRRQYFEENYLKKDDQ